MPASHSVHASLRLCGANVPGAHGLAAAAPVGQCVPAPHSTQSAALAITASDASWCVPGGQGSGDEAPGPQKLPAAHGLQAVCPGASW